MTRITIASLQEDLAAANVAYEEMREERDSLIVHDAAHVANATQIAAERDQYKAERDAAHNAHNANHESDVARLQAMLDLSRSSAKRQVASLHGKLANLLVDGPSDELSEWMKP
jgi:hypothetical protein